MGKSSEMHIRIQDEILNTVEKAQEGELNHLDALLELREHRELLEKALEIIKDYETSKIDEISREAAKYPEGYRGFQVTLVNGRKTFSYKGIPEWEQAESEKKKIEEKYKAMFEAAQKGAVYANVGADGEELPMPEVNFGKSFLTVKPLKR